LCLLGLISYGVYLWHWPVFVVLDANHTGLDGVELFGVRLVVTFAIAIASYHLLEMPIRRGALSSRQWRWIVPASAAALVVLILAVSLGAEAPANGAPDNVSGAVRRAAAHPGATKVLLVGDSVAYQIGVGMKQLRSGPPVVLLNRSIIACTFPHVGRKPTDPSKADVSVKCDQGWKDAVDRFRPDVVLAIFQCCSGPLHVNGKWVRPCDARFTSYARREWKNAIAIWSSHGARVYGTTAPYALPELIGPGTRSDLDCANAAKVAALRASGAKVIDLAGWTCPGAPGPPPAVQCRVQENGVTLRPDAEHFRGPGAQIVGSWLLSQALAAPQAAAQASASP
jgi:hypothetical protein